MNGIDALSPAAKLLLRLFKGTWWPGGEQRVGKHRSCGTTQRFIRLNERAVAGTIDLHKAQWA